MKIHALFWFIRLFKQKRLIKQLYRPYYLVSCVFPKSTRFHGARKHQFHSHMIVLFLNRTHPCKTPPYPTRLAGADSEPDYAMGLSEPEPEPEP